MSGLLNRGCSGYLCLRWKLSEEQDPPLYLSASSQSQIAWEGFVQGELIYFCVRMLHWLCLTTLATAARLLNMRQMCTTAPDKMRYLQVSSGPDAEDAGHAQDSEPGCPGGAHPDGVLPQRLRADRVVCNGCWGDGLCLRGHPGHSACSGIRDLWAEVPGHQLLLAAAWPRRM